MKALVVDGYNAIHKIPRLEKLMDRDLREARAAITKLARGYQRKIGGIDKVYVVFDGRDKYRNSSIPVPEGHIYSRTGEGDTELLRTVGRLSGKYHVEVVTDDNFVRNNSRAHKAAIIGVAKFMETLDRGRKKTDHYAEAKKIDPLTAREINAELKRHWKIAALILCAMMLSGCAPVLPYRAESKAAYLESLYRRVPYEVDGNYRIISVFYATSRQPEEKKDVLSFNNKIADSVSYGAMDIRVDPAVMISKATPQWLKKKGIVAIKKIGGLDDDAFMKRLKDAVAASPHKSLLVLVFGYKDNFEITATKAGYSTYLLDINTPVLLFDWPGDQAVNVAGYLKAAGFARESGPYMGETLARIIREIRPEKLWIESSSLGCQVTCDAFEYMYRHEDLSDPDLEVAHVVLSAPDVGEDEFNERFKDEISAISQKVTAYVSSDDEALLLSGIISNKKKLGRRRENIEKHAQHEEAKDLLYLKSLAPDKIALVDVTPINRASFRHGYYLESPEYFDDLYLRIFQQPSHHNRRLYLIKTEDDVDYWILRRD